MRYRVGLALLQALGALAVFPWPAILVASVMSLAAERPAGAPRFTPTSLFYIVAPLYPILFIWLYKWSWSELGAGDVSRAFTISTVPPVLCLVAIGGWYLSERPTRQRYGAAAQAVRAKVEPVSPLVWTLLCVGGSRRLARAPRVSVDE